MSSKAFWPGCTCNENDHSIIFYLRWFYFSGSQSIESHRDKQQGGCKDGIIVNDMVFIFRKLLNYFIGHFTIMGESGHFIIFFLSYSGM